MKKTYLAYSLILILILILTGCGATKNRILIDNTNDISKISIQYLDKFKATENKDDITKVVNYINGLDLIATDDISDSPRGYIINLYTNDGKSNSYWIHEDKFFTDSNYNWYTISQKQGSEFHKIFENLSNE